MSSVAYTPEALATANTEAGRLSCPSAAAILRRLADAAAESPEALRAEARALVACEGGIAVQCALCWVDDGSGRASREAAAREFVAGLCATTPANEEANA